MAALQQTCMRITILDAKRIVHSGQHLDQLLHFRFVLVISSASPGMPAPSKIVMQMQLPNGRGSGRRAKAYESSHSVACRGAVQSRLPSNAHQ